LSSTDATRFSWPTWSPERAAAHLQTSVSISARAIEYQRRANAGELDHLRRCSAVRTRSNGTSIGAADVDSTQEIQILTADYAPEYGRSSGGQIRITSKSGSQEFHGAAYEYVRNTVLTRIPGSATPTLRPPTLQLLFTTTSSDTTSAVPCTFRTTSIPARPKSFGIGERMVRYIFTDTNSTVTVPTLRCGLVISANCSTPIILTSHARTPLETKFPS